MKKGEKIVGVVESVDFPNKGKVITEEGEQLSVKNVLPGQKVCCAVKKTRKGKAEGRLLEVVEPSPKEMDEPYCPHAGICGGCGYQALPYEEQIALKREQIEKLLSPVLTEEVFSQVFEGVTASPRQFAYRNKMEFSFGDAYRDGPLALGMHKRGSFYDIVTVEHCQIIDEDMRKILTETLSYFSGYGASYYHKMRHSGYLRHLLVRKAAKTGEILVDLITSSEKDFAPELSEEDLLKGWADVLSQQEFSGKLTGVLHTRNDREADVVEDQGTEVLCGQPWFYEELLGLRFRITPFSFFQTNSLGAEVLYETAREFLLSKTGGQLEGKILYDLYSGTGTIAQMLAPAAGRVIGVEIVEEAVEAAKKNAAENGLSNCTFLAGDVLKVLDEIEEKPDVIVLDPPRDGIHPKAIGKIISYGVENIIYISCKPTSLARDLEAFLQSGYRVERIRCVDMFPGTYHVETVVLLSKLNTKQHIEVELNLDELDLTAAESKATYDEIKAYVLEKYGLKVSSLYISQVKRKCGLDVGQNYNLSKKEDAKVPHCPPEKEAAIMKALKYFRMS